MKPKEQRAIDVKFNPRHKIVFETSTSTKDEFGNDKPSWVPYADAWAEFVSMTRIEYFAAAAVSQENMVKAKIRNNEVLSAMDTFKYRAVINGEIYNIKSIEDFRDDGEWILVKVVRK